jgi:hypothetical protein
MTAPSTPGGALPQRDRRGAWPLPASLHGAREPGYTLSKDGRGHVRDEIDFIRVALLDRQFAVKLMVYTPDGHWATEQTGPCRHPTCTNAQRTTREQDYLVQAFACRALHRMSHNAPRWRLFAGRSKIGQTGKDERSIASSRRRTDGEALHDVWPRASRHRQVLRGVWNCVRRIRRQPPYPSRFLLHRQIGIVVAASWLSRSLGNTACDVYLGGLLSPVGADRTPQRRRSDVC